MSYPEPVNPIPNPTDNPKPPADPKPLPDPNPTPEPVNPEPAK